MEGILMTNPTAVLAEYIHDLRWEDLPGGVVDAAKLTLLDYLASAMAGYKINRAFNAAVTKMYYDMGGKAESRVLFNAVKLPASNAAFLNAAYGHGADIDDGHRTAQGHPGVVVIPTALALGEAGHLSGKDLIVAITAGYDVFVRFGTAVNPAHLSRGFHTTGTVGTIAAGGTAAKALKLDKKGVHSALSLSALQSAGLLEVMASGQAAKPLQPAKAAYNGVLSGRMAQAGVEGPREGLEGPKGFIKAFADSFDFSSVQQGLGKNFAIASCYKKLYPACRHVHPALDAAIDLGKANVDRIAQIETIRVFIYPTAIRLTGSVIEPVSEDEAKFSLRYAVATGLVKGNFTLNDLDVAHNFDKQVRQLIQKIDIINDPQMENREANIRGAKVELNFQDGTNQEATINLPKGDPEVPVTKADIENKLIACAAGVMNTNRQQALIEAVWQLEQISDLESLSQLLVPPR
jgi:2-methylcitrate dehydratase PrpD